jgi:hypothetical protein
MSQPHNHGKINHAKISTKQGIHEVLWIFMNQNTMSKFQKLGLGRNEEHLKL